MQHRQPEEAGQIDDTRIGEKLGEVAAHGGRIGRIGRAEIDEQQTNRGLKRTHGRILLKAASSSGGIGKACSGPGKAPARTSCT